MFNLQALQNIKNTQFTNVNTTIHTTISILVLSLV